MKLMVDEGINDSPSLRDCTPWADALFIKIELASKADAYGVFKANVDAIRANGLQDPKWKMTNRRLGRIMNEYQDHGILGCWIETGRLYGFWRGYFNHNRMDTRLKRRYPQPPDDFTLIPLDSPQAVILQQSQEIPGSYRKVPPPTPIPLPIPTPTTRDVCEFDSFYSAYPRKLDRPLAARAYQKALKIATPEAIRAGLDAWVAHWKAEDTETRYIKHPAPWLNAERWKEPPVVKVLPREVAPKPPCKCEHLYVEHIGGPCVACDCGGYET